MANAKAGIARVIKEEGGTKFQNQASDSGNFFNGVNYGTKFGITPGAWVAFYKKPLVQDTIRNLTIDQAIPIYKKNYWDKIGADHIANDSVADLMMFIVVNSGTGQIKSLKHIANATAGKKIFAETTTPFTREEIKLLNALPQDIYFKNLKTFRKQFYEALVQKKPSNQVYLKGWLNRLDKHVYSGKTSGGGKAGMIIGTLLILGAAAGVYYFREDLKQVFNKL